MGGSLPGGLRAGRTVVPRNMGINYLMEGFGAGAWAHHCTDWALTVVQANQVAFED